MSIGKFTLQPYRLRIRDLIHDVVLLYLFGLPFCTLWLAYGLNELAGIDMRAGLICSAILLACAFSYIVWNDFRLRPAGELRIGDGRLFFSAWTGSPIDISLREVKKKIVVQYDGKRSDVLAIYLNGFAKKILIHKARLEPGIQLIDVDAIVTKEIENFGIYPRVANASAKTVSLLTQLRNINRSRWVRGIHWIHYIGLATAAILFILSIR